MEIQFLLKETEKQDSENADKLVPRVRRYSLHFTLRREIPRRFALECKQKTKGRLSCVWDWKHERVNTKRKSGPDYGKTQGPLFLECVFSVIGSVF